MCLATAAIAFAGGRNWEPPKPPHDWPTQDGLTGAGALSGSSDHAKNDQQGDGSSGASGDTALGTGIDPSAASLGKAGKSVRSGGGPASNAAPGAVGSTTLVLYDSTGPYGWLGELYAIAAGNLASHFGPWKSEPVAAYQAGQISQYTATIYLGSTYDEPLPTAFLDDVYNATHP
ncbi:MAG TPA: hypothetical protein VNY33_09115, partial [Gaiellaceae bacterium]|nr:hypothetical protein [Gaiellaceae bacterium]